jgi:hypothetical protein
MFGDKIAPPTETATTGVGSTTFAVTVLVADVPPPSGSVEVAITRN